MKNLFILSALMLLSSTVYSQVGIGTTTPDPSAVLDLNSTNKGFLPPRMTTLQRDAITNAEPGFTIYNTDNNCLNIYVGTGWSDLCSEAGSTTSPVVTFINGEGRPMVMKK